VRLLSNPMVVRMAVVLFIMGFAFWVSTLLLRRMRRMLTEESFAVDAAPEPERFPMHTYNAVIQQLKQQKHELLSVQQVERRRAKTSENISAAVLSNLSSGVLFLTTNGLVRTANAAAKSILGFASPAGMSVSEIFRETTLTSSSSLGSRETLAAAVQVNLREQSAWRMAEADYVTPSGEQRILEITISPVYTPSGETLGAAWLITDKTEFALIQRSHELRAEISGEMALALRNSLATISSYAQQLAVSRDPTQVRQLAIDIVSEAADLDHTIGGFLAGAKAAKELEFHQRRRACEVQAVRHGG
jgi:PAS domain-containing protein